MADVVKKTKAPAKPKSPAAKTKDVAEKVTSAKPPKPKIVATKTKTPAKKATPSAPSREQIAELAHKYWAERGGHHGSHEQDWLRAEHELRGKAS